MDKNSLPFTLHNVCELVPHEGGWLLQRVPESVRQTLNPKAQDRARFTPGVEIRFVWDWTEPLEITLSSLGATQCVPFFGLYQTHALELTLEPRSFTITGPSVLLHADLGRLPRRAFSPRVGRILLLGDPVVLHGVQGPGLRRPREDEVPSRRYIAYGSSITHGFGASAPHLTYPARVGRALNFDVINLGFRGSAHAEAGMANYLAEQPWDVMTLEASVNMLSVFTPAEFGARWRYFIARVARSQPEKPVVVLNTFHHFRDLPTESWPQHGPADAETFRDQIRDLVADLDLPNVSLLEHDQLLRDDTGLLGDLLHPGDDGYDWIARGIIDHLRDRWDIRP